LIGMLRRLACVIVAAVVTVGLLAVPASASGGNDTRYYLALGDSLAFGYQPNHDFTQGYPAQLYATLHARQPDLALTNLGCPGETSGSMRRGGVCPYPAGGKPTGGNQLDTALAFLRVHAGKVRLITLDIGANDVNGCVATGVIDQRCVFRGLLAIVVNVSVTVARLRAAAPGVTIVGMTYYDPTLAAWLTGAAGQALARDSLPVLHRVNGLLSFIFRAGGLRVADVAGAFSTDDMSTMVNGVPLDVARICQWTWMCAPAPLGPDIHANQAGYGVIAGSFLAEI
jgi:lysophospholipase L1-like esterase